MPSILQVSAKLEQKIKNHININGTTPYSYTLFKYSNTCYEILLIIYEINLNLKKNSYAFVTSCGTGHHTLHLYKLSDDRILLVDSGIDGIINKVDEIESFIINLIETLEKLKNDWEKYKKNDPLNDTIINHPNCVIPQVNIG